MSENKKKIELNAWNVIVFAGLLLYLVVRIVAYFVPNSRAVFDLFTESDTKGRIVNGVYIATFFLCPLISAVCVFINKRNLSKKLMSFFYFVSGLSALTAALAIYSECAYVIKNPSSWALSKEFMILWFASATTAAVFVLLCLLMFYQVLFQINKPAYAIVLLVLTAILVVTAVINLVIYAQGEQLSNLVSCLLVLAMRLGMFISNVGLYGMLLSRKSKPDTQE